VSRTASNTRGVVSHANDIKEEKKRRRQAQDNAQSGIRTGRCAQDNRSQDCEAEDREAEVFPQGKRLAVICGESRSCSDPAYSVSGAAAAQPRLSIKLNFPFIFWMIAFHSGEFPTLSLHHRDLDILSPQVLHSCRLLLTLP
jgi:hypothetical protein